jgi:mono/diheme cytochrome c family protein
MKKVAFFLGFSALFILIVAFYQGPKAWEVPSNYQHMRNPVKADSASIAIGRDMYGRYCKSCHGITGKGDGPRAEKMSPPPGDFTSPFFARETDGAIFYKMTEGHKDMPSFKKRIPSNDDVIEGSFGKTGSAGDLINYIRTLGRK